MLPAPLDFDELLIPTTIGYLFDIHGPGGEGRGPGQYVCTYFKLNPNLLCLERKTHLQKKKNSRVNKRRAKLK